MTHNVYQKWGYEVFYWRTQQQLEVDFVLYGQRGFFAIEIKCSERIRKDDLKGIEQFLLDYPEAKGFLLYTGRRSFTINKVQIVPVQKFIKNPSQFI